MKKTSIAVKILLVNIGLSILVALLYLLTASQPDGEEFAFAAGIAALMLGIINLFVGLVLIFTQYKTWRDGFFLTSGVLLLLSGITCGAGAAL
ncbi:hypothetical protein [Foetidibacter luteolus]|uniref:hypothetical protein n=1 Tax=Foetidibacter luteolus TaxID=2608880 RepID=UPI00129B73AE|nr:hypothetical protein [Foetidibacter luteolus]